MPYFYRFEDLSDESHNPGLSDAHGPTIKGERIFFGKRFRKSGGEGAKLHHHPNEQFIYVLKGKIHYRIGEEEKIVTPGTIVHIPPNVSHSATVYGDEDVETIYVKDTTGTLKGIPG